MPQVALKASAIGYNPTEVSPLISPFCHCAASIPRTTMGFSLKPSIVAD
jgi:hypothetical protein